ncbi:MAG: nSTAND1 domain-containing NTPase, partial [Gammaproteobacteria bacterium]
MSESRTSPAEPGASAPPESAALRQRLDLVHHLIGFGRQVILVAGAAGSGRSRMLDAIAAEADPAWLVIRVAGRPNDTCDSLLRTLLDALEPERRDHPTALAEAEARLRGHLNLLQAERRIALLLADDCDGWSEAINAMLFRLCHTEDEVGELRMVLCCNADGDYATRLEAAAPLASLLHRIDVPPLDRTTLLALAEREAAARGLELARCRAGGTDALLEDAGGNPGRLLRLLDEAAEAPSGGGLPRPSATALLAGTVLACGVAGLLLFLANRPEPGAGPSPVALELPAPAAPAVE